jgi:hypothetical protein
MKVLRRRFAAKDEKAEPQNPHLPTAGAAGLLSRKITGEVPIDAAS